MYTTSAWLLLGQVWYDIAAASQFLDDVPCVPTSLTTIKRKVEHDYS